MTAYRLPRRYRYPRYRRSASGAEITIGIGVAAAVIAAAAYPHAPAKPLRHAREGLSAPAAAARITSGSRDLLTPAGWAHALLAALGDPQTSCDFNALTAWGRAEGGGFGNQAAFDPLNVNPGPGASWPGHPVIGAWAFPDAATGLRYTVQTLDNGYYGSILAALRAGNSAQAVCNAIMASPWAESHYSGSLTAVC